MTIDNRDISAVDAFLLDRLSHDERVYFDSRLSDKVFVSYLEEQTLIREVLEDKGREEMKRKLQLIEATCVSNVTPEDRRTIVAPFYKRRSVLAIAASILLMLLVIGVFKISNENNSEDLFAANYTPYPNLVDPITKGLSETPTGFQFYEQKNYLQAIEILSALEYSEDQEWYLALSYIGVKDYNSGLSILKKILNDKAHSYYNPSQWYRALLYLREAEVDKCKVLLKQIENSNNHLYADKARLLLMKL